MKGKAELETVYDRCIESLRHYVLRVAEIGSLNRKQVENLIAECRIDSFLSHSFSDKKDRARYGCLDILQRNYNALCREEIRELADSAHEEGIKLIILKGVVFSERYYFRPEKRRSGDIDILIGSDDFVKFVQICGRNGYRLEDGKEIDEFTVRNYAGDFFRDQHFNVISKYIKNTEVNMDIHVSLIQCYWFAGKCRLISEDFWRRSVASERVSLEHAYELEVHDLIIYLGLHFLQHFYRKIWEGFSCGGFVLDMYFNLLLDIACVLMSRSSEINWDYFCKLCNSYQIDCEMANVLEYVCQIFGGIVPLHVICELDEKGKLYTKDRFYYSICRFMMKMDLAHLLGNPTAYWLDDYIDTVIKSKKIFCCRKNLDALTFKGQYAYGCEAVASKMDFSAMLKWNETCFYITMKIKYEGISLVESDNLENFFLSDKNFIVIGIHGFECRRRRMEAKALSVYYNRFKSKIIFSCDNADVKITAADDRIIVEVPWFVLGITPMPGKSVGTNIIWTHYSTETEYARVGLSENPTWHDIMGMYRIGLSE